MHIDCHCHLAFNQFDSDRESLLIQLKSRNYRVIETTVNEENTRKAISLLSDCGFAYFCLGFHPYFADKFTPQVLEEYRRIIKENKKVIAIGEIGLDYKSKIPINQQKYVFSEFLKLAKEANLPAVIHNRGFKETILEILEENKAGKTVFHCFSQDKDFMQQAIKRGYYISYTANITYPKNALLAEAVKNTPLNLLLAETDSPYLAPQSIRGKRNNPTYVKEVVEKIAELKNISPERINQAILTNAKNLYGI